MDVSHGGSLGNSVIISRILRRAHTKIRLSLPRRAPGRAGKYQFVVSGVVVDAGFSQNNLRKLEIFQSILTKLFILSILILFLLSSFLHKSMPGF
jgi:hypothetical protein